MGYVYARSHNEVVRDSSTKDFNLRLRASDKSCQRAGKVTKCMRTIYVSLFFHLSQKSVIRNPNSKKSLKSKQKSNARNEIWSEIGYLI